ncbi:hypothetical protein [Winogradskyella luteola]|uniref:STAS/SEC14 domain-containing protein n=1 Tax=Winogradskyella luteola TaxID=2828330 RepID=A0A9X1F6V9_9FLAO|nr:hypothetical protein [Winogradskyella luteola]MBV7268334.1 hypothetical protein [Winogradskyella luteola]
MINSPNLNNKDHTLLKTNLGSVYLFDNYIITDFKEGIDITFDNFNEVSEIIKVYFEDRPFGFIANRVNSYSINLTDASKFNANFPNLKAYAVVVYNTITERVFEIENHFFTFNRSVFKEIDSAVTWIEESLSHKV